MLKLWNYLQGRKTYLVALATLVYAWVGYYLHFVSLADAVNYTLAALGTIGFRSALNKLQ